MATLRDRYCDELRRTIADLRGDGRGWILLAVASGWFLSIGVRLTYPAVLPGIRADFGFGLSTAGLLLSVMWTVYALGQFPGGVLADRQGAGRVLLVSTGLSAVTILLVATSRSLAVLFATTALLGLSTALYGPARFPLLSATFPERSGTAIGMVQASGNLGNALLPAGAGVLAGAVVWQAGFAPFVALFVVVAVAIAVVVPGRVEGAGDAVDSLSAETVRYVLRGIATRSVLAITAIQMLGSFTYQGFTGFYPTYLVDVKGISPAGASVLFGLFFASGILVQPLTGMAGDRFGERRSLFGILAAIAVALAALPFVEGFLPLAAVTVALSALLGRSVLALTYLTEALPADMRGTGLGLLRTGYILVGATSPLFVGVVADAGYFDGAFLALAAAALAMIVVTVVLPPLATVKPE